MQTLRMFSILMAFSCFTNMFSEDKSSQTEFGTTSEPVFTTFILEARGEANYCCEGSESKRALYEKPQYLSTLSPAERERLERLKQKNIRACCGWPYPTESGKEATSHVITIIKNPCAFIRPQNSEQSETMLTPLNPHGVVTSEKLWEKRRGLFFKDEPLDNGASLVQNPATDSDIRFLGGSFEQGKLIAKLAMNAECRANRVKSRDLGQNEIATAVFVKCPNATYHLRHLAKKSVDELVNREVKK